MKNLSLFFTLIFLLLFKASFAQDPLFSKDVSNAFENANGSGSYMGSSMIIDQDGNINMITTYFGYYGLVIVKYNPSGQVLNQILVPDLLAASSPDGNYRGSLLMDQQKNYYVAGIVSASDETIKLEKLSNSGKLLWSYVFGSQENTVRNGILTMGPSGNIYVAGHYYATRQGFLAKITQDGDVIWSKSYDHQPVYDYPVYNKLIPDASGFLYATGEAFLSSGSNLYLTEKYDSSGNLLWSNVYSQGVSNGNSEDMAIASSGNIYTCGQVLAKNSGGIYNMITVKYDKDGNQLWTNLYQANKYADGHRILLDDKENVYTSGISQSDDVTGWDVAEIKYDKSGAQKWLTVFKFGSFVNYNNDDVVDAAFDQQGNTLLLSLSNDTLQAFTQFNRELLVKINKQGSVVLSQLVNSGAQYHEFPSAMVVDASGNIYTSGGGFNIFNQLPAAYLIKRDAHESILYQQLYQTPINGKEYHKSALLDANGNFYAGNNYVDHSDNNHPRNIYQYDTKGNLTLVNVFQGGTMSRVVRDRQNNILVGGFLDYQHEPDIIACDDSGRMKWEVEIDLALNTKGTVADINSDANGNIYAVGYQKPKRDSTSIFIYKYDASGNLIWNRTYDGPGNGNDESYGMSIDNDGNIFICGRTQNGNTYNPLLLKYDSNGNLIWTVMPSSVNGAADFGYDVVTDDAGGCFVTGRYTQSKSSKQGFVILKVTANGAIQWLKYRQDAEQNQSDFGTHLLLDTQGNIFAEGRVMKDGLPYGISVIKFNKNGKQKWIYERSGYNFAFDDSLGDDISYNDPLQVTIDPSDNVYLENVVNTTYDVEVIKLNSDGEQQWIYTSAMPKPKILPSPNIASDAEGNVWCVFNIYSLGITNYDWRILKFSGSSSPQIIERSLPEVICEAPYLIGLYPNPARDVLTVSSPELPLETIDITVRNVFGQIVYQSSFQNQATSFSSQIPIGPFPAGIYSLELTGKNLRSIRQFIKQ